ncbi:copper uptake system-associated protein [Labrenzia sp. PHM005]|uniref:copper uptake system-associated protein n=1 Tax=Labrenzia sp. PHM005 TaxID=2590016 RepID=UPI00114084A6|nr:copper uptake system-associated protein [Labrenzia sp. PHM005]QDG76696.1 copper uptake system-associated protein [Labrenzia sp. PHM005]
MNTSTAQAAIAAILFSTSMAQAHATLEVKEATINSYYKAVMRIPHGCDGQATLKVKISVPEGMISVKPMPKAGWTLETVSGDYAHEYELHGRKITSGVQEIVWSGSLEDSHFDEFVFRGRLTDKLPAGQKVFFQTVQDCADGTVAWSEIPAPGQDPHDLKRPAPGLMINAAAHDHSHAMPAPGKKAAHNNYGDAHEITHVLKAEFDTPETPLTVEPVVISGAWAIAGWSQDGRGGRALMKKDKDGWYVHMCGGEPFKHAKTLSQIGLPHDAAMSLASDLADAENKLAPAVVAMFDGFGEAIEIGRTGHGGHGGHGAHTQSN